MGLTLNKYKYSSGNYKTYRFHDSPMNTLMIIPYEIQYFCYIYCCVSTFSPKMGSDKLYLLTLHLIVWFHHTHLVTSVCVLFNCTQDYSMKIIMSTPETTSRKFLTDSSFFFYIESRICKNTTTPDLASNSELHGNSTTEAICVVIVYLWRHSPESALNQALNQLIGLSHKIDYIS